MSAGSGPPSSPYRIAAPERGWAEQDPLGWGRVVDATVLQALDTSGVRANDRLAVSITGQMHSTVLLDDDGEAVPRIPRCG